MKKYYYTIGEVCNLLQLKSHVLRYWEKEFPSLRPKKGAGRNRKYSSKDIELLKQIQYMLYTQKYTIDGARKKLSEMKRKKREPEWDFIPDQKQTKKEIIKKLKAIKEILSSELS